jgi:putative SOS response-associated peptidase YedK
MCGRFTLSAKPAAVAELLGLPEVPELFSRYNVAPTQTIATAVDAEGGRKLALMRWGIRPSWSPKMLLLNAKAETIAEKPTFRKSFRERRCLIPADGFFEWAKVGATKQPYHFRLRDGAPFAFAGIWEPGEDTPACCVITTEPNELVRPVHDRMPCILPREHFGQWLDPDEHEPADLLPLLVPYPADLMAATPVSTRVNDARYDGPECVQPAA